LCQNKLVSSAKIFTSATFGGSAVYQLQKEWQNYHTKQKKALKSKQKTQYNVAKVES